MYWHWNYFGTRPEKERGMWEQLEKARPKFIVCKPTAPIPPQAAPLLKQYRMLGKFASSYCGQVDILVHKDADWNKIVSTILKIEAGASSE